jgi:hypothetical protein
MLLHTDAAWVEFDTYRTGGAFAEVYKDGPGRYAVRLKQGDQTCNEILHRHGFDPTTLDRSDDQATSIPSASDLLPCLVAERLGDMVEQRYIYDELPTSSWLNAWNAPYILLISSERDTRSDPDLPVQRTSRQVIRRSTGAVIAETIEFSYRTPGLLHPNMHSCMGLDLWSFNFPGDVFSGAP